jgi:Fe2+ transport system protein B
LGIKKGEDGKDGETVVGEIKKIKTDLIDELRTAYKEEFENIHNELKNTEANEQRLYAILTLFMTNCKISESAKAEILNILADVKKYEGSPCELVAQAQEAIDNEIAEKEAQVPATPTLDKILDEDYMELG